MSFATKKNDDHWSTHSKVQREHTIKYKYYRTEQPPLFAGY